MTDTIGSDDRTRMTTHEMASSFRLKPALKLKVHRLQGPRGNGQCRVTVLLANPNQPGHWMGIGTLHFRVDDFKQFEHVLAQGYSVTTTGF